MNVLQVAQDESEEPRKSHLSSPPPTWADFLVEKRLGRVCEEEEAYILVTHTIITIHEIQLSQNSNTSFISKISLAIGALQIQQCRQ